MLSITELTPRFVPVVTSVGEIGVKGLSLKTILGLVGRFPALKGFLFGGARDKAELLTAAPEALAAFVAAATGNEGLSGAEDAAAEMLLGDQLAIVTACVPLTLPDGIGPFVAAVEKLAGKTLATG